MFGLFSIIIAFALGLIEGITGIAPESEESILATLYALAVLLPTLGVGVRRLHDTGRSGWWLLIVFVPLIGAIVFLVFMVLDSHPGENEYGPNPKFVESA